MKQETIAEYTPSGFVVRNPWGEFEYSFHGLLGNGEKLMRILDSRAFETNPSDFSIFYYELPISEKFFIEEEPRLKKGPNYKYILSKHKEEYPILKKPTNRENERDGSVFEREVRFSEGKIPTTLEPLISEQKGPNARFKADLLGSVPVELQLRYTPPVISLGQVGELVVLSGSIGGDEIGFPKEGGVSQSDSRPNLSRRILEEMEVDKHYGEFLALNRSRRGRRSDAFSYKIE